MKIVKLTLSVATFLVYLGTIQILFVSKVFSNSINQSFETEIKTDCLVYGEVRDRQEAVIPKIPVTFFNSKVRKTVKADYSGEYKLKLPFGIYNVKTELDDAWETFERAKIGVFCKDELLINIYSFPKIVEFDNLTDKYNFESFSIPFENNNKLNSTVVFLKKESSSESIIYSNAILTYGKYTLSASKIIRDTKNNAVIGKGNAWVEDGKKRIESDKITLIFSKDGLKIDF